MYRSSFVSNSSSSSFILAVRNGHKVGDIDGGVFVMLASELARFLRRCDLVSYEQIVHDKLVDEYGKDYASEMTDSWVAQEALESKKRMEADVKSLIGPGERIDDWQFHRGLVSSDGGEIVSQMLYEERVEIKEENVRLG